MHCPAMTPPAPKPLSPSTHPPVSLEELRACTDILERLLADASVLLDVPEEDKVAFLRAVGRVTPASREDRQRRSRAEQQALKEAKRLKDRDTLGQTQIRTLRRSPVFTAPPRLVGGEATSRGPGRVLETPRACYVCKVEFAQLHFFYDALCPPCAELNYAKRFQDAKLAGKTALITGARVKIGYHAALMLLRSGARVIVTTRFPNDAALRYSSEPDFKSWSHRLDIHGLDLRHAPSVELFAQHIANTHDRLDILINNAAQTVRRPPGFYSHLSENETRHATELPLAAQHLLDSHNRCIEPLRPAKRLHGGGSGLEAPSWRSSDPGLGLHASAALSQVPYALEQAGNVSALFPKGRLDADLQQVDLRAVNTWRLTLSEVETSEMLEVHLINAVAPFILCGKLKPLMLKDRREPGHIVNVSAMEGSFSRGTKTDKHPHTNMAKAALNMMTLTSAPDYARGGIFMNAADTGWVTDEDPFLHAERKQVELDFQPPLDIVDGAARIIDPVFTAIRTGEFVWGNFFKDYLPTAW